MKKRLILGLTLLLSIGVFSQTLKNGGSMKSYEQKWTQIQKLEKDDLPKSAINVIDEILKQAIADKNTSQTIKALIYKNKYQIATDKQENTQLFTDLENLIATSKDMNDKALLHSMLAELYLNYYDSDRWTIDRRTNIAGFVPDDMKEWSKNIFQEKALSNLEESVKYQPSLLKQTTKSYKDIIELGDDSQTLYPTLYDFLMNRAIDQSARITSASNQASVFQKALATKKYKVSDLAVPASDFVKIDFSGEDNLITLQYYKEFLQSLVNRNKNESLVLLELQRNSYLSGRSETYRTKYAYDFLQSLEKKNQAYDYNVEVISALVDYLNSNNLSRWDYYRRVDQGDNVNTKKAYDWCKYGLEKYPNYKRINLLKGKLALLESPYARVDGASVYHPDNKNKTFKLTYKNLKEMTIKVKDKKTNAVVKTEKIALNPKTTYSTDEHEFTLELDKIGNYEVIADFDKKSNTSTNDWFSFSISSIADFARTKGEDQYEFYIVDRLSGKPMKDASIIIYAVSWSPEKYTKVDEVKTNAEGFSTYDLKKLLKDNKNKDNFRYVYRVSKDGVELPQYQYFTNASGYSPSLNGDVVSIFTDRSIYRPGQIMYFKAISAKQVDKKTTVLNTNKQYKVSLYNANNQLIVDKILSTNEFGSISGEFVLPQNGLTGQYRIEVGESSQYFNVEEYKRPTFQITFDKIEKTYAFGDVVKLIGRAENYSGAKVQGANVEYSITKSSFFRWWSPAPTENIDNGTVTTNDDGSFEITFTAPLNDSPTGRFSNNIFNFSVNAEVTDINGETQSGNYNFAIGDVSMILSANIPSQLDKASKEKIHVTATNLNGQAIEAKGNYTIYSVLPNDSIKAEVLSGSFTTDTTVFDLRNEIVKLPSARYMLSLNAKDDKDRNVVSRSYFILYSLDDKTPPIETNEWLIEKQKTFSSSKNAEIVLGISAKNATILYDLLKGDKLLQRQHLELSNENKKFVIPYKEEYGDQITAVFTYVIDEKPYIKQVTLLKEEEAKNLNLKFEVFRDKLRPGQQEEWRISVKDNKNKPAFAELLASMYDSSLDQLQSPSVWMLNPQYQEYIYPRAFSSDGSAFGTTSASSSFASVTYKYDTFKWDQLNWFGFRFYGNGYGVMVRGMSVMSPAPEMLQNRAAGVVSLDVAELKEHKVIASEKEESNLVENYMDQSTKPQIRTNFNETAFFYPQLKTDKNGETVISFTVPESNTTWKFRALAYDKSLNIGSLEALSVSRKELMVTPNMPRFVREGDKTSISTKISNLSDKAISGKVRIEFFDPLTDQVKSIGVANQYQDFTLEKDASGSVTWTFEVPADIDMLGCRIIAESASFSDGEQHVVSVLPNRMLVTESMTMNVNGNQTKDFAFEKLINNKSNTLSNYRLTLEYTGNPAWYAVQALPTLSNPTNENAVNWFASYYVNTLGSFMMKQYPKVATMIEAWKKQGGNKETLVSKLQKNEELKAVLLEETPWVLDAKNETEQMNRLSLLFDLNNTNMQTQQAIAKLQDLQNPDGGWSWYKDMYSSRSMTQYILYGFSQLVKLNAVEYPNEVRVMQMNALKYIDTQMLKDFTELKKHNLDWAKIKSISTNQLEYLYVRSNYRDIPIDQATREAEKFYTSVVEKNWTDLNLYERSLLVVLSVSNGNKAVSDKIMNSIREHATVNDEMGMFWANNASSAFMSNSAVTVHSFIMEAFQETKASANDMDLMKQWLLKQKQTQVWESTHATIDAIYALLSTGSDWFASTGESKIFVNNKEIESKNKELGTGYIKESWSGDQILNQMGNVKIEKSGDGPAWGAMYWQYYEDLNKITTQKGELNIDKKLFVEKATANGKTLVEVTESNPLKVGDKVIMRLTVRVDRDMEFVHLKDMRASCFEPIETLSGLRWQNNTYYYQSTKDASTNFFFDHLAKGTYVFEYPVYVNRSGEYSNGITSIQCMYAPEFISNTNGIKVIVQ